jgi:uncharacterized protein YbjQ (UPF0145 family)
MGLSFENIGFILTVGAPVAVFIVAYLVGSRIEKKHFTSIRERETALRGFPIVTFDKLPDDWTVSTAELVSGSIVVSVDYFKRVIAGLRGLIGGRIKTYEPLLDRARRDAILRMAEAAKRQGYDAVFNVRLETSRLANARRNGSSIAGVEMLAYGTAVKFKSRLANS